MFPRAGEPVITGVLTTRRMLWGPRREKLAVFRRVRDEIKRVFEAYAAGRRDQAKCVR